MKGTLFAQRHPYWFVASLEVVTIVVYLFLIDFASFLQRAGDTITPAWNLLLVVGLALSFTLYGLFVMLQKNSIKVRHNDR